MIKTITTIFLFLFSISLISAISIYSGEPVTIELEKPFAYYSVVGNSTEVILDITQNGNNVTIIPDKYSQSDSYEVIFFDIEKETITIHTSSGGGGGTRTIYKDKKVTEYVDRDVIKYLDKENEIVDEPVVVGVEEENKPRWWVRILFWVVGGFVLAVLMLTIYMSFKNKYEEEPKDEIQDTTEREEKDNE